MKINLVLLLAALLFVCFSCEYTQFPQGMRLYESQCSGCHGLDGKGFKDLYPPLYQSDYFSADPYATVCIITNGMEGEILVNGKKYDQPMQAIEKLSAVQITNILNYISDSWNPSVSIPINIDVVKEKMKDCENDPKVY